MDTETISGLHACKPGNEPVEGQVKLFVVQQMTSKQGKAYLKIKAANAENGGTPYRILSAAPTGYIDKYNNVSFNLEIEPATMPTEFQQARETMQQGRNPEDLREKGEHFHEESTWESEDAQQGAQNAPQSSVNAPISRPNPPPRPSMLDERQRAIIRQHSQSMALEVLKLKVTLNELTVEDLTPAKLRTLADYFDNDVYGATNGH